MLRSIPLWSETLELSGRADAVEIEPGVVRPVEYKSGIRHGSAADLQLCAQALCLEEMLDVEIPEGDVWYGGPRRRVRVAFTPPLRHEVGEIIHEIRQQLVVPRHEQIVECHGPGTPYTFRSLGQAADQRRLRLAQRDPAFT